MVVPHGAGIQANEKELESLGTISGIPLAIQFRQDPLFSNRDRCNVADRVITLLLETGPACFERITHPGDDRKSFRGDQ